MTKFTYFYENIVLLQIAELPQKRDSAPAKYRHMESELNVELGYEKSERMSDSESNNLSKNYRNGYSKKTVKTQLGEIEVNVPRDRNGK